MDTRKALGRRAGALALLAVFAALGAGCSDFNLYTLSEEQEIGDNLAKKLDKELTIINDSGAQQFLDLVGERLVQQSYKDRANQRYRFYLVKDKDVNAFAIPGGHCYVNTGLVKAVDEEDELAAVMAHEISHVVERHGTKNMSRGVLSGTMTEVLFPKGKKDVGSEAGRVLAKLFAAGGLLHYSRSDEYEADRLGLKYMNGAGYDPQGMLDLFEKLKSRSGAAPGAFQRLLSTHPLTNDRITAVKEQIKALPVRGSIRNTRGFPLFKDRVEQLSR